MKSTLVQYIDWLASFSRLLWCFFIYLFFIIFEAIRWKFFFNHFFFKSHSKFSFCCCCCFFFGGEGGWRVFFNVFIDWVLFYNDRIAYRSKCFPSLLGVTFLFHTSFVYIWWVMLCILENVPKIWTLVSPWALLARSCTCDIVSLIKYSCQDLLENSYGVNSVITNKY